MSWIIRRELYVVPAAAEHMPTHFPHCMHFSRSLTNPNVSSRSLG